VCIWKAARQPLPIHNSEVRSQRALEDELPGRTATGGGRRPGEPYLAVGGSAHLQEAEYLAGNRHLAVGLGRALGILLAVLQLGPNGRDASDAEQAFSRSSIGPPLAVIDEAEWEMSNPLAH
jgi:hypothetical protein